MPKFLKILICWLLPVTLSCAAGLPRSSFFVANEGQWEGEFAFRYEEERNPGSERKSRNLLGCGGMW
jgi:hypothetical protein